MTAGRSFDAAPIGQIAANLVGAKLDRKTRAYLGRGDSPRTGQPVWRNSYYVGQKERQIWHPINDGTPRGGKRWTRALLEAAKAFELRTRNERRETEPKARNGALGPVGLAVLEYLYKIVDYAKGTLEPAIRTIAEEIGHAYSAVHRALVRLRIAGFLDWMRRSEPIEDPEPGGPLIRQASNAYGLLVPEAMQPWLARLIGRGPTPACEEDRIRLRKQELEAMLVNMTASEYARDFVPRATLLGPTLRSLAAAIDRRDALLRESSRSDVTGGSF